MCYQIRKTCSSVWRFFALQCSGKELGNIYMITLPILMGKFFSDKEKEILFKIGITIQE
jgi:hypothetical protein